MDYKDKVLTRQFKKRKEKNITLSHISFQPQVQEIYECLQAHSGR